MATTTLTQRQISFLETHLRGTGRSMSAAQALGTYGIKNLSARISEMRNAGLIVRTHINAEGQTAYSVSRRDAIGLQSKTFAV